MTDTNFTVAGNIEHFTIADIAQANPDFRKVIWTGRHAQIVLMTIPVGSEIGDEVHPDTDQILTFVSGTGHADPAGTQHNFRNTGDEPLVLYTTYSPPEHAAEAAYATKDEADAAEAAGQDVPPRG